MIHDAKVTAGMGYVFTSNDSFMPHSACDQRMMNYGILYREYSLGVIYHSF